jgi:hypothetical protein
MKLHGSFGVLAVIALRCAAQFPTPQVEFTSLTLDAGSTGRQLLLDVDPTPGDFFQIYLSTAQIRVTIRTPDNRTITSANAKDEGFDWSPQGEPVPLQLDAAQNVLVVFTKPSAAGRYTLEFSLPRRKFAAHADVRLISRLANYISFLRTLPGARFLSRNVSGAADIPVDVPGDFSGKEPQFFDIVTKTAADVSITTPDGKVLKPGASKEEDGYNWTSFEERYGTKNEIPWLMCLPIDGTHQLVAFKKIAKGRYLIHVESRQETPVSVAFLPVEQIGGVEAALQASAVEKPAPDEVKIRAQPPDLGPNYPLVGDKLPLIVRILGDIGASAPKFEVRMQTVPALGPTPIGSRRGTPQPVVTVPANLTHEPDGAWYGSVEWTSPGSIYVSIRVSGTTRSGEAFQEEALVTNPYMIVNPVVARLVSVAATPVDVDGDGKFDRLDITAELDVILPGNYLFGFSVKSNGREVLPKKGGDRPAGKQTTLSQGRQKLTQSFPGRYVWSRMGEGTFVIGDVWVLRLDNGNAVGAPSIDIHAQTAAWTRDQWSRGNMFGEDTVSVHGIRPAPSGKFRFVEVQWDVTAPGGLCSWRGILHGTTTTPGPIKGPGVFSADYREPLPAGPTTLSFLFDAAGVAVPDKRDWDFQANLHCGSDDIRVRMDASRFVLNQDQFEAAETPFLIRLRNPIRLSPGGAATLRARILGVTAQVQFTLANVPNGLSAKLSPVTSRNGSTEVDVDVQATPDAKAGRYVIDVSAESGAETARTELLVDVVQIQN